MIKDLIASIKLRFYATDQLHAAMNILTLSSKYNPDLLTGDVKHAKLLVAKELIRRNELFWEDEEQENIRNS